MNSVRECPCCRKHEITKLFKVGFSMENCLPKQYSIVCCKQCGFVFADSFATQEDYNRYYRDYNDYAEDSEIKHTDEIKETTYSQIARIINKKYEKEIEIIDIGCGAGDILKLLKHEGFLKLTGLDPSKEALMKLEKNNIKTVCANIFDKNVGANQFQLVISTCVAEHIFDLHRYIEGLISFLDLKNRESRILISVPATEGFPYYLAPRANYFNQEHINYFSVNTLDNLMRVHGMKRENEDCYLDYNNERYIYGLYYICDERREIEYSSSACDCINEYINRVQADEEKRTERMDKVLEMNEIIVFGAGQLLSQVLVQYPELREKIKYIVDNNSVKHGRMICGIPIRPVGTIIKDIGTPVLICAMFNQEKIIEELKRIGVRAADLIVL